MCIVEIITPIHIWLTLLLLDGMLLIVDFSCLLQDGIEECRKLCGGHGYLCTSGLPELFAVYVPACTYEGDNIVLLLQVSDTSYFRLFLNCFIWLL